MNPNPLYNRETYAYNEVGIEWGDLVRDVLVPLVRRAVKDRVDLVDLEALVVGELSTLIVYARADVVIQNYRGQHTDEV